RPFTEVVGRTVVKGGSINIVEPGRPTVEDDDKDPYFVDLLDMDLDTVTRQEVMAREVVAVGALYSIDDNGIRLTINRRDPASSVSLSFSSAISSWVLNPYTYGAKLDATGFSAFGATPVADWVITPTADTIEAFFAFGAGGQPFDYAIVNAPDSQF